MKNSTTETQYLHELASSVLTAHPPAPPSSELDWGRLYQEAARLSMVPFICYGVEYLSENDQPELSVMAEIRKNKIKIVLEEAKQQRLLKKILSSFDEQGIKCLLGKDLSLKNLYPYPDIRCCEKIELFLREEAFLAAHNVLRDLGGSPVAIDKEASRCYQFDKTTLILKKLFYDNPLQASCVDSQKYKDYSNAYEWRPEILYKQLADKAAEVNLCQKKITWLRFDLSALRRFYGFDAPGSGKVWNKKVKRFSKKQKPFQRNAQY